MQNYTEKVKKDDIVMFVNACLACTSQNEFYEDEFSQNVTIEFLHQYLLKNYREIYCQFLTVNINDFNKSLIIFNLLATGKDTNKDSKDKENKLIEQATNSLAKQRVYKLFNKIRKNKINNRRTRAVIKKYLAKQEDISFDVIKYKNKIRPIVKHCHINVDKETADFLFIGWKKTESYKNNLYQNFKKAHYSKEAVYDLPYSIAEGFANKWQIKREIFLEKIMPKMTFSEKYRLQNKYKNLKITGLEIDYYRMSVTKNALYILSLAKEEKLEKLDYFEDIMNKSAQNFIEKKKFNLNKVVAVLDRSYSSSGSTEKKRRPLAIAMATDYILKNSCLDYQSFWTAPTDNTILLEPQGATAIADLILKAICTNPDMIIIVSDGYENAPFNGTRELIRVFSKKLFKPIKFIHLNPVFSAEDYMPKTLSDIIPTFNIRDAEDISFLINFADYAENNTSLKQLEAYLNNQVEKIVQ